MNWSAGGWFAKPVHHNVGQGFVEPQIECEHGAHRKLCCLGLRLQPGQRTPDFSLLGRNLDGLGGRG